MTRPARKSPASTKPPSTKPAPANKNEPAPPIGPMGIDIAPPPASSEPPSTEPAAEAPLLPQADKPECPYCKGPCTANRSEPYFTRYYCPTRGCTYSVKVPRPRIQERLYADRMRERGGFDAR